MASADIIKVRHASWVGYTVGYRKVPRAELTFKVNCLRETCDSDPSLQKHTARKRPFH
jgi:hypothetical protein